MIRRNAKTLESVTQLEEAWRASRRRIDALVADPVFTGGSFLTGFKVAYYHATSRDTGFHERYQAAMQELMSLQQEALSRAQGLVSLHLQRNHSEAKTRRAYPSDAASLIRDLRVLIERVGIHIESIRSDVPCEHQSEMDEPFGRFSNLATSLIEALEESASFANQVETRTLSAETGFWIPPGYKQTEVGVIPEDWEVGFVGDHAVIKTGSRNTQDRVDNGEYPFFVRSQTVERINTYSFDGEAVLTAGDGVGTGKVFHYINGKFDTHQRVYRIADFDRRLNGYYFFLYFSNHFYDRIMQMTAKSSVDSVRMEMIARMQIPLPPTLAEQEAIAGALSDADGLIDSLEQLLAKKRQLKQGAMEQLLTGQTRLPGFEGEWEARRLGSLAKIQRGASPRPIDSPHWFDRNSSVGWVRISDVTRSGMFLKETTQRLSQAGISRSRPVRSGSLIMSICATVGRPVVTALETCIHDGFVVFDELETDKFFLYYALCFIEPDWSKHGQTGSQMNLNTGLINGTSVPLPPTLAEQTAIAAVLSDMDAEVASLEAKLAKARQLKQGMMQELLTGNIRLV